VRNKEVYRQIFERLEVGIFIIESDHQTIIDFNRAMCNILNYNPENIIGSFITKFSDESQKIEERVTTVFFMALILLRPFNLKSAKDISLKWPLQTNLSIRNAYVPKYERNKNIITVSGDPATIRPNAAIRPVFQRNHFAGIISRSHNNSDLHMMVLGQ
jgi:transcriptional regulator with PAS, ATPase and Fis domain